MADVNVSIALQGIASIEKELAGLRKEFDGLGKTGVTTARQFDSFAKSAATVGAKMALITAPIALIGKSIIQSGADFESAMNRLQVQSGAGAESMAKVEAAARAFGKETVFSAGEAADAFVILAKNGITVEESLGGVAQAAVNLAAATGTDLSGAADIASKAMSQFGASATDLPFMMDQLYNATSASTFELGDLALALAQGGGAAATAGLDFGEFNTAMVTVSNNVSSGSDAGTAFKSMLIALVAPTKEAAELQKVLGINVRDTNGNLIPARDIVGQLSKALEGQGSAQKLASAATLVGQDAVRGLTALAKGGTEEWDKNTKAVNEAGTTAKAAAVLMEGFNGAMKKLSGAIDDLGVALYQAGFLDWLTSVAEGVADVIEWFGQLDPLTLKIGASIAAAAVLGGPFLIFLSGVAKAIVVLLPLLTSLTAGIGALNTAILAMPLVRFAALLGSIGVKMQEFGEKAAASLGGVKEETEKFSNDIGTVTAPISDKILFPFKDGFGKVKTVIDQAADDVVTGANKTTQTFEEMSSKITAQYAKLSAAIADNEGMGLDEKMTAFAGLGQALTAMGEKGVEAANNLREAMKKAASESAEADIAAIMDDVSLSFADQGIALEQLMPKYGDLGKFGKEGLDKIGEAVKGVQADTAKYIKDADWGIDTKMAAFADLEISMKNTGNTGVKAFTEFHDTVSDTLAAGTLAEIERILSDTTLTIEEQIAAIVSLRENVRFYGEDTDEAFKLATEAADEMNATLADSQVQDILDDTTKSLREQWQEIDVVARKAEAGGDDFVQAAKESRAEADQLAIAIANQENVLLGVATALTNNELAWGGWGDSAGRIVEGFSTTAEQSISDFIITGTFDLETFGDSIKRILADEAAKTIVSFASSGIKAFADLGTQMFTSMLTGAAGMDTAAISAWFLNVALAPILLVVLAIAAAIGIFVLAGGDLGDLMNGLIGIVEKIGGLLLTVLLAPINLLIAGFDALVKLLELFVKWLGSVGDALGKGDLKDLFKMFEGFNPLKGIGDLFSGIFGGIFHKGGLIPGLGDIAIRAEGGEYVINRKSTEMFGPLLELINARGLGESVSTAAAMAAAPVAADPFRAFAEGGDMMLTRPTLLLGGEKGAEVVSFRSGRSQSNGATIVNKGILVADRMTMNALGKKLFRQARKDNLRLTGR